MALHGGVAGLSGGQAENNTNKLFLYSAYFNLVKRQLKDELSNLTKKDVKA